MQEAVEATRPSHVFSGHWHERETATVPGTTAALHVLDRERRGKLRGARYQGARRGAVHQAPAQA